MLYCCTVRRCSGWRARAREHDHVLTDSLINPSSPSHVYETLSSTYSLALISLIVSSCYIPVSDAYLRLQHTFPQSHSLLSLLLTILLAILTVNSEHCWGHKTTHNVVHVTRVLSVVLDGDLLQAETPVLQHRHTAQRHVSASCRAPPQHVRRRVTSYHATERHAATDLHRHVLRALNQERLHCEHKETLVHASTDDHFVSFKI